MSNDNDPRPGPDDDIQDFLNTFGSLEEARAWVEDHAASLTDEQRNDIFDWIVDFTGGDETNATATAWQNLLADPAEQGFDVVNVLNGLDPNLVDAYFEENYASLPPEAQGAAREWLVNSQDQYLGAREVVFGDPVTGTMTSPTMIEQTGITDEYNEQLEEAAGVWADILGNTPDGDVPDVGRLNNYLPAGMTDAEADAFIAAAQEQGQAQADDAFVQDAVSQGASEEEARALAAERRANQTGDLTAPLWLRKFVGGDRNLTEQVKQRYLDYWNDDHGTNFTSWNQLTPILESMGHTAYTENMTNSVLAEQEPLISHSIEIPFMDGAKRLSYTEDEMQALRDMGFNNDAITRLVRLAGLTAGRDAIEPGPNGDTLPISAIAGLLKYYGAGQQFGTYNQLSQDVNALEAQLGLRPEEYRNMTFKERQALRARLQAQLAGDRGGNADVAEDLAALDKIDALFQRQAQLEESVDFQGAEDEGQVGVLLAQNNLKRGLDTYNGDSVLAFIHAVDPALAQRIASSGEDPTKLSGTDNARALRIMERGGMLNRGDTMFERLGGRIRTHIFNELSYFDTTAGAAGGGGGGGGAGPIRRILDPVSVKEQLQKSFADLMLDDVDDAVVTSFTAMLQKQLDGAPEGMSFDVSARILDWVKGQPGYAELYRNKPGGMTEQEYQAPFMAGVQDMLGAEANPEAVKAGMRENEYQTAVGRASAGEGLNKNSRLRENWALAAQTLDEFS
jgi:hypothetical protein